MKKSWQTCSLLTTTLGGSILIVYHLKLSLSLLWPTHTSWMFTGDWAQHYLSWELFRAQPWQWPLGTLTNYFYPVTTNIGYTDAIPLFALVFKICSPILPNDFQYIGIWLLLCLVLQAGFAVLLLRACKITHPLSLFAGAMFFVLSPVLLFRVGHPALCAQWLIVASLWLYITADTDTSLRLKIYQLLLLVFSAFIHPYLAIIVLGFTISYFLRLLIVDKTIKIPECLAWLTGATTLLLVSWYIIGYFSLPTKDAWETGGKFTMYSANVLGFINPLHYSKILPNLPLRLEGQYEGFAYLGMGMLLLLMLAISLVVLKKIKLPLQNYLPLLILVSIFTLLSLSNEISLGTNLLYTYSLPSWCTRLTNTFRATGRFIWVAYYSIFAYTFYVLGKSKLRRSWLAGIIFGALLLQIFDTSNLISNKRSPATLYQPVLSDQWHSIINNRKLLVLYPPFQQDYLVSEDYVRFVYLAHQHNLAITTGYLARYNATAYANYLTEIRTELHTGQPEKQAVYVTTSEHQEDFDTWMKNNLVKKITLDGYVIFLPVQ